MMCGVLCTLAVGGWLQKEQSQLAGSVIRFHVIANSDSREDQALKLAVRDQVLKQAEMIYPENATLEEAGQALERELPTLAAAGQQVVDAWGHQETVTAQMERCWFPTKEYDGFALPAGYYNALRVVIGEGAGQNWWCVAFPPLCLGAASEPLENAVEAGYFTASQAALVREENEGYIIKFKGLELLGQLQRFLFE